MGWEVTAVCAAPLPAVGPETYYSSGAYPGDAYIALTNACTTGQAPGIYHSLQELPAGARSAVKAVKVNTHSQIQVAYKRNNVAFLPAIWAPPNIETDMPPMPVKPPPAVVRPHLKPDWKSLIDETVPNQPPKQEEEGAPSKPEESKEVRISYGRTVQTQTRRYQRVRKPTRRNEKEKKFAASGETIRALFGWLARNKERITELVDFLDVLIDAMPKDIQSKEPKRNGRETPDLKARFIYENWEKIDWGKAAEEWVKNWIEDKAVGAAIAGSDKAAKLRGETNTIGSRGSWLHNAIGGGHFPR